MSLSRGTALLASGVQGGHAPASLGETVVIALLIIALTCAFALIVAYLRRRRQRPRPVTDQWRALAVMGELCPYGWEAHITLYGWGAPLPADAPATRVPPVELEWKQYGERSGTVAVQRRLWAQTISDALAAMVEDRRTDLALEQIERDAEAQGELWAADDPEEGR